MFTGLIGPASGGTVCRYSKATVLGYVGIQFYAADFPFRTDDGRFIDPFNEGAGGEGSFFWPEHASC